MTFQTSYFRIFQVLSNRPDSAGNINVGPLTKAAIVVTEIVVIGRFQLIYVRQLYFVLFLRVCTVFKTVSRLRV